MITTFGSILVCLFLDVVWKIQIIVWLIKEWLMVLFVYHSGTKTCVYHVDDGDIQLVIFLSCTKQNVHLPI